MPRAGLSAERVVDEAERLADEVGLAQLSLAALAARLGVQPPSPVSYTHLDVYKRQRRSSAVERVGRHR